MNQGNKGKVSNEGFLKIPSVHNRRN